MKSLFGSLPYGICPFSAVSEHLIKCRKLSLLPENAESVLCVLFPYYLGEEYYQNANVSMYAVPADYHDIAGAILAGAVEQLKEQYPENAFEAFCDDSPIPEVRAAVAAGLGVRGQNGLLINEVYGSYCFIGEIVTDLKLPYRKEPIKDCISCGQCRKACPTGALSGEEFSREICLSAVSQQKKELTPEQIRLIAASGSAWGCDICQRVCPMNISVQKTPITAFFESAIPVVLPGADIKGRAYAWRGDRVINRNLEILSAFDQKERKPRHE